MIWRILAYLIFVIMSGAYFLHIYNIIGFTFTVKCLFIWGFSIAVWTACSYILKEVLD